MEQWGRSVRFLVLSMSRNRCRTRRFLRLRDNSLAVGRYHDSNFVADAKLQTVNHLESAHPLILGGSFVKDNVQSLHSFERHSFERHLRGRGDGCWWLWTRRDRGERSCCNSGPTGRGCLPDPLDGCSVGRFEVEDRSADGAIGRGVLAQLEGKERHPEDLSHDFEAREN